jgi:Domain of unknown function (DUF4160)
MPSISHFYGITIWMYWNEGHHSRPHFHAYYGEHEASFDLAGEIIVGSLPKRALRLVQDWAELYADDLLADWERVVKKQPLKPIPPLR